MSTHSDRIMHLVFPSIFPHGPSRQAFRPALFRFILLLVGTLFIAAAATGQSSLRVALLSDASSTAGVGLDSLISNELRSLLGPRFALRIDTRTIGKASDSGIDRSL